MSPEMLHATQVPASLRAVDGVASLYHDAAKEVGCRVYGHSGGLTIKERYVLAEKREALLRRTRDESIRQREKQRVLRGKLIGVEKHAKKMQIRAAVHSGRQAEDEGTHSFIASIRSQGTMRSVSSRSNRTLEIRQEISTHVESARSIIGKIDRAFSMARARCALRAAINNIDHQLQPKEKTQEQQKMWSVIIKSTDFDFEAHSPRSRYIRRRAATCLQRHARGRAVRRLFDELTWAVLHFRGVGEPSRYPACHMGRQAMLLARLRISLGAYYRLKPLIRAGDGNTRSIGGADNDAARESRIILWTLRDTAARIIQEEIRHYARFRLRVRQQQQQQQQQQHPLQTAEWPTKQVHHTWEGSHTFEGASSPSTRKGAGQTLGNSPRERIASRGQRYSSATDSKQSTSTADNASKGGSTGWKRNVSSAAWQDTGYDSSDNTLVGDGNTSQSDGTSPFDSLDNGTVCGRLYSTDPVLCTLAERGGRSRDGSRAKGNAETGAGAYGMAWTGLLRSEQLKKRRNEASLRRNTSRRERVHRSMAGLEFQGICVLPEIIKLQRHFRARRSARLLNDGRDHTENQDLQWKQRRHLERDERAARWRGAISRLGNVPRVFSSCALAVTASKSQDAEVCHGSEDVVATRQVGKGVEHDDFWSIVGKELPYADANWGLAVAYNLGSWHGGLRQQHYYGRLKAYLCYRRRRKAALRVKVKKRMIGRLENWTKHLAETKREYVTSIKAHSPPDVVGAHYLFLTRAGNWNGLLRALSGLLQKSEFDRDGATEALKAQSPQPPLATPKQDKRSSSSNAFAARDTLSSSNEHYKRKRHHPRAGLPAGCHRRSDDIQRVVVTDWEGEAMRFSSLKYEHVPVFLNPGQAVRLKHTVEEDVLAELHPWLVAAVAASGLQFVPSVPLIHRIGNRVVDACQAELYAERPLTRRYWRFLEHVSRTLRIMANATEEARALVAEAGEWCFLLGFARHLVASGYLDPPCALPNVPRLHAPTSCTDPAAATSDRRGPFHTREKNGAASSLSRSLLPQVHEADRADRAACDGGFCHQAAGGLRWFTTAKELCPGCLCLRGTWGGGQKCRRCGLSRAAVKAMATDRVGRDATGPVSWQQFHKVEAPLDLFIIHAAYACIIHPGCHRSGCEPGGNETPKTGGSGWWSGGSCEQAWWRAVCGGTRSASSLRQAGYDTIGGLFALATSMSSHHQKNRVCTAKRKGGRVYASRDLLLRLVDDEDLGSKIAALFQMLLAAFAELRKHNRWPMVGRSAIDQAFRPLKPPPTRGTASARHNSGGRDFF